MNRKICKLKYVNCFIKYAHTVLQLNCCFSGVESQMQHDKDSIQFSPHSNDNVLSNSNDGHVMGKSK